MLAAAAFVPGAPMLVPAVAAGAADELAELRAGAVAAVGSLLTQDATEIVVLGVAPRTGPYPGQAAIDLQGVGLPSTATDAEGERLPRALSVGRWVLDAASSRDTRRDTPITAFGITDDAPAPRCRDLGSALAERSERVVAIVVGDGSARRSVKAPGAFDESAAPFDAVWMAALGSADLSAIDDLDQSTARALLVEGRAPWQVASGMAAGGIWTATLIKVCDPYGVQYAVATWERSAHAEPSGSPSP